MNTSTSYEYYQRQLRLKGFGEEAQRKLQQAKILVIGAGGLGCPAIQYLSAMGIGCIGVVDGDLVSASNLHRQILFSVNDIGKQKAQVVFEKVSVQHTSINIHSFSEYLTQQNAFNIIEQFDIVLDCTDNFLARYIINDVCVLLKKPLVFGAVFQYEGQVAVFNLIEHDTNYRDLFPLAPNADQAPDCAEAGVYAITTGIIGVMQAGEAIKVITGIGNPLRNQLLTLNMLTNSFYQIEISARLKDPKGPGSKEEFLKTNYHTFCSNTSTIKDEIDAVEFDQLIHREDVQLIDIRNEDELPRVDELNALRIPLLSLKKDAERLDQTKRIVLFCHSGMRTQSALEILQDELHFNNVSHLKGGIIQWIHFKSKQP